MKTEINIKVQKEVDEIISLELPHYRIGPCHAYKVFSEDKCIQVCHGLDYKPLVEVTYAFIAFSSAKDVECSKPEFDAKYIEVLNRLNTLYEA